MPAQETMRSAASVEGPAPVAAAEVPVQVIEAGRSTRHYWKELWRFRELFMILAWRDVAVRYKQTIIGILWAVIRPLLTMLVFTVVFGRVANLPSDGGAPYALMVLAGMLPWMLFSTSFMGASESLVSNANLVSKVYFPRMIVPTATVVTGLVDFLISLGLLIVLMIGYGFAPSSSIFFLPGFVVLAVLATLGPGLWMSALTVKYRDFRHIIPFVTQFGVYISPVGFSSAIVPERWRIFYSLNPMVGVIDGFRWCILGPEFSPLYFPGLVVSMLVIVLLMAIGLNRFRRTERTFADMI